MYVYTLFRKENEIAVEAHLSRGISMEYWRKYKKNQLLKNLENILYCGKKPLNF